MEQMDGATGDARQGAGLGKNGFVEGRAIKWNKQLLLHKERSFLHDLRTYSRASLYAKRHVGQTVVSGANDHGDASMHQYSQAHCSPAASILATTQQRVAARSAHRAKMSQR